MHQCACNLHSCCILKRIHACAECNIICSTDKCFQCVLLMARIVPYVNVGICDSYTFQLTLAIMLYSSVLSKVIQLVTEPSSLRECRPHLAFVCPFWGAQNTCAKHSIYVREIMDSGRLCGLWADELQQVVRSGIQHTSII